MKIKRNGFWKISVFALLFAVLAFVSIGCASADTIYVPDGYAKIQHAVDNATAGDTILVRDGTYTENVNVNVNHLTIKSENGTALTIVQAVDSDDHVFVVSANYVNISGFTVKSATEACGINLNNASYCNFFSNIILNNEGGILLVYSMNNIIINNTVKLNNVDGIRLYESLNNSIMGNNISNNEAGIDLEYSLNNTIINNNASNNDLGIHVELFSSDNTLTNNTANSNNDYGIYLSSSSNNLIYNNYFDNTNNVYDERNNIWNIAKTTGTNIIGGPFLGGNYWSDYTGSDNNGDGIGDTLLPYNSSGNITNDGDYLPLVIQSASISGRVCEADGVTPIEGATVTAVEWDATPLEFARESTTDANGTYIITNLSAGDYRVYAYAPEYGREFYNDTNFWDDAQPVSVIEGQETPNINFSLGPGGSISGTITSADSGTPLSQVSVFVRFADGTYGAWAGLSDDNGNYTIIGLPYSTYKVLSPSYARFGSGDDNYIMEFWQEKATWDDADIVTVAEGINPAGINFTLEVGGTISGYVYQEDGVTPLPNVRVNAENCDTGVWMMSTNTDQEGYYSLVASTGTYRVRARPSQSGLNYVTKWYNGTYDEDQATAVSVTAPNDTPNINFTLEVAGTISGFMYLEGGVTLIPNVRVEAKDYDTDEWMEGTNTDQYGCYTLVVPTGTYRVRARPSLSGLNYVSEWYNDTYDKDQATTVSVTAPNDTSGINFTLEVGGTISGYVFKEDGVTPLPHLHVYVEDYDTDVWMDGTDTDQYGYYTLVVPTGTYRVRACPSCSGLNYVSEWYNDTHNWDEATAVSVTAPDDTPDINFTLEVGGTISGYVYQEDGVTPLSNVHVNADDYDTDEWMEGTNTNQEGYYSLVLPTGTYRVRARPSLSGLNYVSEWYNDTYDRKEATAISVSAPNDTPDINFTLEVGGTISGYVYQEDGNTPLPNVHVNAKDYDTDVWMEGTDTNQEGYYSLVLPNGTHRVRACPSCSGLNYVSEWYNDTYDKDQATTVSVTAPNDTSGINFTLGVGGTISGYVYQEDGVTPLPDVHVYVEDFDTDEWMEGTDTDPDGFYSLVLPNGTYRVRASPSENGLNYVSEWYNDTHDWDEATAVSVTAPDETSCINFTLEPGGTISGYVYQEDGVTPLPDVHVYAVDFDTDEWMEGTDTDQDGHYSLVLPTGTYQVCTCGFCCNGPSYAGECYDGQVSVTVPNDTSNINFTLVSIVRRGTIEDAIADGVAWLAAEQNPDGSWGSQYQVAKTALAVLNLETHATEIGYSSPFDPAYNYSDEIESGLNYLFSHAHIISVSDQTHGGISDNPDTNGNGTGIYFRSPNLPPDHGCVDIYETSIAVMGIAASTDPTRVVNVPGSAVDGWTYEDVLQDAVDYTAWAQTDSGFGRGGWNYEPMDNSGDRSDQSNSGWVTLGLAYAEAPSYGFELTIPGFVRSELDIWIDYIRNDVDGDPNDGGSDYTGPNDPDWDEPWVNILKTGNLLQQMAFVGDTATTQRAQDAINYTVRHWNDDNGDPGWSGCPTCYHATYTTMKGLEALNVTTIDSIDWFHDFTDALLSEQTVDGWWMVSCFDDGEGVLSTEWALLTLQKRIPQITKPDLTVLEKHEEWMDEGTGTYRVFYTVKNRGNMEASAGHNVSLTVDGAAIEQKTVPVSLAPAATYSDSFDMALSVGQEYHEIVACADSTGIVDELNEDNNCLSNIWPYRVHNLNTSEDFSTIQEAIDASNTTAGHTIMVDPETYNENVNVYKSLTIRSTTGNSTDTIVNAINSYDHVFEVTADHVDISGFTVTGATGDETAGILLVGANHCDISENNASNNFAGIGLFLSSDNTITSNTASNNSYGIVLSSSSYNTLINNTFVNDGLFVSDSYHNTVENNTVNSKPLVYLEDASDCGVEEDAGQIILVNCDNIMVENQDLSNATVGVELWETTNSTITNNTASNNYHGILLYDSSNNLIYLNNLINNTNNAYDASTNQWNTSTKGNYYSDYTGSDNNSNGIGDTPYEITGGSSVDHFPLMMHPWKEPPPLKGDLDDDSQITSNDAAIVLEIAVGSRFCDSETLVVADVSGDGKVSSLDALIILQMAA